MTNLYKEIKKLLSLALPLVLAQFFASGKGFVDVIMVGNIDKTHLAALALAFNLYFTINLFSTAMSSTVIATLSRYLGRKENAKLLSYAQQNMYFHLITGCFVAIFFINSNWLFNYLNLSDLTKQIAWDYMFVMGLFYPILCFRYILRPLLVTFRKNEQYLYLTVFGFLLNIPFNYVLIYGKFGFPELGAVGSAYATALCTLLEIFVMAYFTVNSCHMNIFRNLKLPDFKIIKKIIKQGAPAGLAVLAEFGMFSLVVFMLASYGEDFVAGHQVASTNMGFIFIMSNVMISVINQRLSYFIGKKDFAKLKTATIGAYSICLVWALLTMAVVFFFANEIAGLYTKEQSVIAIATSLLLITLGYQILDNIYLVGVGVMRAFKQNTFLLKTVIVSYWCVGFPFGFIFSQSLDGYAYWYGFIACFAVAGTATAVKVYKLVWQKA